MQCCCGKYDGTETVVINGIVHEPLGPKGNMCAPIQSVDLRNAHARIAELEGTLEKIIKDVAQLETYSSRIENMARDVLPYKNTAQGDK